MDLVITVIADDYFEQIGEEMPRNQPHAVDMATAIVGELQSKYRIEPLENTVEKEATK